MSAYQHQSIEIHDRSSIGDARRVSTRLAARSGLETGEQGRVPLVVTELATNLLSHARHGEILVRVLREEEGTGIEVLAIDHGPGIADLAASLADGYSGGGTRGCGLGAVRRQSTEFDIYSIQPSGTVVVSRIRRSPPAHAQYAAVCVAAPRETECGDGWGMRYQGDQLASVVIDGLGHGPLAAAAALQALEVFRRAWFPTPVDFLQAAHEAMRSTRGAAVAIAHVDFALHQLHYAGVGNIASRIVSPGGAKQQALITHAGIIGGEPRKLQQFDYKWHDGDLLVMHSDGLSERWNLSEYPGLMLSSAGLISGILYRDAKRGRDDATVLVTRLRRS